MAPPGLLIRATEIDDAQGFWALANLPGVRWGTMRMPFESLASTRRKLERMVAGDDTLLTAVLDGTIIGNGGCHRSQGRRRYVASLGMSVHDDHTGRGIGTALLETLIDAAFAWHDVRRLQLEVFHDNQRAIHLYERLGFEHEGRLRGAAYRGGRDEDLLIMARHRYAT